MASPRRRRSRLPEKQASGDSIKKMLLENLLYMAKRCGFFNEYNTKINQLEAENRDLKRKNEDLQAKIDRLRGNLY